MLANVIVISMADILGQSYIDCINSVVYICVWNYEE